MEELSVSALVDLLAAVEKEKASGVTVYVLFCGSRLENGESWCPDCVKGTFHCICACAVNGVHMHDVVVIYGTVLIGL